VDIIKKLKYLDPASEFRAKTAYQNTMFIVASKIVEEVTDVSWDEFIRDRIFGPLEMNNTVISQAERNESKNISTPHIKDENFKMIPIKQEKLDNMAPAGSFYSSANDMAHYMNFILNNGIVENDTLVSKNAFNEILKPQIHFKLYPEHNEFTSYGLGWFITPINGDKIVDHSGAVDGMTANLIMVKNKNYGVIVLTNSSSSAAGWITVSLTIDIIGSFLQDEDYRNISNGYKDNFLKIDSIQAAKKEVVENTKIKNTKPSLALEKYAGNYNDKMYGDIFIIKENSNLIIKFSHTPLFTGSLSHWHFDTFEINWYDPRVPRGFLTFKFNSKGDIIGFDIDQPSLLDVDFSELKITRKNITTNKRY
jgi:CubicO group peptidase (beta-lactamase class C family)